MRFLFWNLFVNVEKSVLIYFLFHNEIPDKSVDRVDSTTFYVLIPFERSIGLVSRPGHINIYWGEREESAGEAAS